MTESMPSRVQPAHAAQKPVICERLSLVRVAAPEYGTAISDMVLPPHRVHTPGRKQFVGQHTTGGQRAHMRTCLGSGLIRCRYSSSRSARKILSFFSSETLFPFGK